MRGLLLFPFTVLAACSMVLAGENLYVPSVAYPTIQSAIDAAAAGDAVVLHDGVFQGQGNTDLVLGARTLTLRSENGPNNCVIDGDLKSRGMRVDWGDAAETTIAAITIRNGASAAGDGAGIWCNEDSRVNVLGCVLTGCRTGESNMGGGIACAGGSRVSIRDCVISHCRAGGYAGGIWCDGNSTVEVIGCTIRDNEAFEADNSGGHGGGLAMRGATVSVSDTDFVNNWAIGDGGAVTCDENSTAWMIRCRFLLNTANERGGGVCFWDAGSPAMTDCVVADNRCLSGKGGGVFCHASTPTIEHCTIVSNRAVDATTGGGIYSEGAGCPTVVDAIVRDNLGGSIFFESASPGAVSFSDVAGGFEGFGNIDADPRLAGPARSSVHVDATHTGDPLADGSEQHPFANLQQALGFEAEVAWEYMLADDSPCIGMASDGENMGALRGAGGAAGPAGVTVYVAPGVYSLADCSFQRNISLIGAGAEQTILEGPTNPFRFLPGIYGLRTGTLLKGVTVRGCAGYGLEIDSGQSPVIEDCSFTQNSRGGVSCRRCGPTFTRCLFSENSGFYGGGVYCNNGGNATLVDCIIRGNTGYYGAGFYANSFCMPVIRSCTIAGNTAFTLAGGVGCVWGSELTVVDTEIRDNDGGELGGGVMGWNSSVTLSNCTITGNTAKSGGGVGMTGAAYGMEGEAYVVNCVIAGNVAREGKGGGVWCEGNAGVSLNNTLVAANRASDAGGGLGCDPSRPVNLSNCTVVGNSTAGRGGAIFSNCTLVSVTNSVLWGNTAGLGVAVSLARSCSQPPAGVMLAVVYSLVEGGQAEVDADAGSMQSWGDSNRESDPLFVSPAGPDGNPATWADNDYRLRPGSPAIDAGNDDLAPIDRTDLDHDGQKTEIIPFDLAGLPRRMDDPATPDSLGGSGPRVDMGAYEYFVRVRADFDGDGDVDPNDLAAWQGCSAGPYVGPLTEACAAMDLDGDGDLDQADFGLFQRCFSGRGMPANSSCMN